MSCVFHLFKILKINLSVSLNHQILRCYLQVYFRHQGSCERFRLFPAPLQVLELTLRSIGKKFMYYKS